MHIHVLGFGAIGTLVSHYLRAALDPKHTVSVVHKTAATAIKASHLPGVKLERNGVVRTERGILHVASDPSAYALLKEQEATLHPAAQRETDEPPTQTEPVQQHSAGPIESLIVATKAPEAVSGIRALLPRLSAASTIVLLHNGMGVYEQLIGDVFRNRLHRPHIVVSVNNHGAFVKDFGQVVHTGVGSIELGIMADTHGRDFEGSIDTSLPKEEQKPELNDITPLQRDPDATRYLSLRNTISALTSTTALDVSWRPLADVQLAMHRKLAVNCVINPLTALLACRNGDLFKHPSGRRLAAQICQEISNVFYAEWRREVWKIPAGKGEDEASAATDDSTDEDVTFVPSSIAFLPVSRRIVLQNPFPAGLHQQQLLDECARVAELTRANVSSMLVDIRRGRPTEIHCLNGYILKLAKKHRVSVPVTAALIDLIHLRQKIPIDKPVPLLSVL